MNTITKIDGREVVSYNTTETAAKLRAALKAEFPRVAFSVRCHLYSMGSSVYVRWTDGPTTAEVERITDRFTSKSFDGSDDSTHYHTQTVDGREVQYSGYINTSRDISPALRAEAEAIAQRDGLDNVREVLNTLRPGGLRVRVRQSWAVAASVPDASVVPAGMWPNAIAPGVY